jgi:hypothetical protein
VGQMHVARWWVFSVDVKGLTNQLENEKVHLEYWEKNGSGMVRTL